MKEFTRETAERVAKVNGGKVSPNMDYLTFPGYWENARREYFASRFENVTVSNGTGTWTDQKQPMSNGDYYRTSIVMISWD